MNDRWKNRRRMAWIALIAGVVYPFFPIDPQLAATMATSFYLFVAGIVSVYTGAVTVDDKWQRKEDE